MLGIIKFARKLLHKFDFTGETIKINMRGRTKNTSTLGSIVGVVVYGVMCWFIYTRFIKLIHRSNPTIY